MALSKVDLSNQVENILPETLGGTGASQFPAQFRNIIINGDMSIAQRGTSASGVTTGGNGIVHSVDRMQLAINSAGTWTVSQETDAPTGQGFTKSLKFLCTTNEPSISAGGYITFLSKFEGQNLQYLKFGTANAESLTASFWIKSSKTGNFIVELADRDNVKFNARLVSINSANTWEKKTVTFQGNTTNSFNNDNGWSMDLQIWFGTGTTYSSGTLQSDWQSTAANRAAGVDLQLQDTTNANVYLTGVQLEVGTTASDFEFLPYDVNLQRCLRYYNESRYIGSAVTYGTNVSPPAHYHPVQMRASPTLSMTNVVTSSTDPITGLSSTVTGFHSNNNKYLAVYISSSSTGYGYINYGWTADAEL